tara:strand:- start:355 stop:654 length:300 start_codon:yes stop_codon:yes gene_type:complete
MDIPEIYLEDPSCLLEGLFNKEMIEEYDTFFRRLVTVALGNEVERCVPIVMLADEETEYYIYLDKENVQTSLKRALKYFEWIEEYLTCKLVLELINENK